MTRNEAVKRLRQLETMCTYQDAYGDHVDAEPFDEAVNMAIEALERKRGKWLLDGRCSECLVAPLTSHKNYCPNCGADMRATERNNDV